MGGFCASMRLQMVLVYFISCLRSRWPGSAFVAHRGAWVGGAGGAARVVARFWSVLGRWGCGDVGTCSISTRWLGKQSREALWLLAGLCMRKELRCSVTAPCGFPWESMGPSRGSAPPVSSGQIQDFFP